MIYFFLKLFIFLFFSKNLYAFDDILSKKNTINIIAKKQILDLKKHIIIFTGSVKLSHGTIKIFARKIQVSNTDNKNNIIINAWGQPVRFYEKQKQTITGCAKKIHFSLKTNRIELIGGVHIKYFFNTLKSDYVTYEIKNKTVQAFSHAHNHVITIIDDMFYNTKD